VTSEAVDDAVLARAARDVDATICFLPQPNISIDCRISGVLMVAVRREPTLKRRLAMVSSVQRKVSNGIAGSFPAEILAYARAAYPQRRSSNANSLQSQNSAGYRQSVRSFKAVICVDISEFESYMPSLAGRAP